jgi:hypothetical protein
MIKHDNAELRENLNLAVRYLTKPDYYAKLHSPSIERTFGKANAPAPLAKTRRKPRKVQLPSIDRA